jgi:hypothetical protein
MLNASTSIAPVRPMAPGAPDAMLDRERKNTRTQAREDRRVRGTAIFLLTFLMGVHFAAAQAPVSGGAVDAQLIADLVAANRILADQGVLDAYGHVSIRHPANPNRYLVSRAMSPANVTDADIMEFDLDSNPVDPRGRSLFLERFIHGEMPRIGRGKSKGGNGIRWPWEI